MQTLNLTLTKKWFDMIASGEKKEEYREITPYWYNRLMHFELNFKSYRRYTDFKNFDTVHAVNGYGHHRPNIKWKHLGTTIGTGKPEWGAEPGKNYFILKIGELL